MECRQVTENRRLLNQVEIAMFWLTSILGGRQGIYICDGSLTIPARPYDKGRWTDLSRLNSYPCAVRNETKNGIIYLHEMIDEI
jgi:hypothetical protein